MSHSSGLLAELCGWHYAHPVCGTAPSKSPALPNGRATEQAEAQVGSPRVSKGCASRALRQRDDLGDFDGAVPSLEGGL